MSVPQYAEGLSDRQAADQVRARMDWKFLLGLELDDPGFDFTVLADFRSLREAVKALGETAGDLVKVICWDAALADGRSPRLRPGGRHAGRDRPDWPDMAGRPGVTGVSCEIAAAGGTRIVPGMADGHRHLTLPGGSPWISRDGDPAEAPLAASEMNGQLRRRPGGPALRGTAGERGRG